MENYSAYELAQQRIEQRQRNQNHTLLWLILASMCIVFTMIAGWCVLPITIIAVLFAVSGIIEWYFASPRGSPPLPQIQQEIAWLFGESWESDAGVNEYALALERIHKRRMSSMKFIIHLTLFLMVNGVIINMIINSIFYNTSQILYLGIIPVAWLVVLINHAIHAFPTQQSLAQREQEAGEIIRREIEQMQPAKRKTKLKRDVYYVLDDDGELVEVDQEAIENDKPKHQSLADSSEDS